MKRNLFTLLMAISIFLMTVEANAALLSVDSPVFGIGSITLDESTGMSWLDLSITAPYTLEQVLSKTSPGESFDGFRLATIQEVKNLIQDAGVNTDLYHWSNFTTDSFAPISDLMSLMGGPLAYGDTGFPTGIYGYMHGHVADDMTPDWYTCVSLIVGMDAPFWTYAGQSAYPKIHELYGPRGDVGTWLVHSATVPEPSTLLLLGAGMVGFAGIARKRLEK
jgi:hypothetical protein